MTINFSAPVNRNPFDVVNIQFTNDSYDPELVWYPLVIDAGYNLEIGFNPLNGEIIFKPGVTVSGRVADKNFYGPADITVQIPEVTKRRNFMAVSEYSIGFWGIMDSEWEYFLVRRDIEQYGAVQQTDGPIEMLPHNGESTCMGGGDVPAVNLTSAPSPYRCLMMYGGQDDLPSMKGDPDQAYQAIDTVDFAPAREILLDTGESQGTAMMWWLDSEIIGNGEDPRTFLYRTNGKGGQVIANISKGTYPYDNSIATIAAAAEYARKWHRKNLVVRRVALTIGANDRSDGTDPAVFKSLAIAMADDYNNDIPPVLTEQPDGDILIFMDQIPTPAGGNDDPAIALAQLELAEEDSRFLIPYCNYFLQGAYGIADNVHNTPEGYDVRGEYVAKLDYDLFYKPTPIASWKGVRPETITITGGGTKIVIKFYVPVEPLVLDVVTLPNFNGNYGFTYSDSGSVTISSVALISNTEVELTMSANISGNTDRVVGYADAEGVANQTGRSKVWGNLHDSETRESQAVPGLVLYNWGLIFRKAVV